MSTKACKKCGWHYPAEYPALTCRFCKTPFDEVTCAWCGETKSASEFVKDRPMCKACKSENNRLYHKQEMEVRRILVAKMYSDWLKILETTKLPPLTEAQWIKACIHFKGCAYCGSDMIDMRAFFVRFKDGGRYNALNVLPTCEICGNKLLKDPNPFKFFDEWIGQSEAKRCYDPREKLERILEYFNEIMEEAANGCTQG